VLKNIVFSPQVIPERIELKSQKELEQIRETGELVSRIAGELKKEIRPGLSTGKLNIQALELIHQAGAEPAFLGYRDYPASICVSLNEEVVHGIPQAKKIIKPGDILSLDLGVRYQGFYGDLAFTLGIGEISPRAKKLIQVAHRALELAIKETRIGRRIGDISWAIQSYVENNGFSVVHDYCGHGIGRELHKEPAIPCFGKPNSGIRLLPGMVLAIETMVNAGSQEIKILPDGWTAVTVDGSLSAHFEHMVLVTNTEPVVLTYY